MGQDNEILSKIEERLTKLSDDTNKISLFLYNDPESGNEGLVQKGQRHDKEIVDLKNKTAAIEKQNKENLWKVGTVSAVGGAAAVKGGAAFWGFLWKIIGFAFIFVVSVGCSGKYHLKKAYSKGALQDSVYTEVVYDTTTVGLDTLIPIFYDSTILNITDTIICDSLNRPVLISGGGNVDSERVSASVTLQDGVLTSQFICKSIQDSLHVALQKNVRYATQITHTQELNSSLIEQLEESNKIKGKWALSAILFGVGFILIGIVLIVRRVL